MSFFFYLTITLQHLIQISFLHSSKHAEYMSPYELKAQDGGPILFKFHSD